MNPRVALAVAILVIGAAAAIVWSTLDLAVYTAEVCVTFEGRTRCSTASGSSRQEAIDTGVRTACATLAGGVGGTIACNNTAPDSVRWIEE